MYHGETLPEQCITAALKKHAKNVVVLDLRNYHTLTDYFVICSGWSKRQVQAIAEGIREDLKGEGIICHHIEGYDEGCWILMDFGAVVIHVFQSEVRLAYDLEHLWKNAERTLIREDEGIALTP